MGINIILPIIAGIIATIIIGGQVAPSYMEQIKIKKVENVALSNQEILKDAIIRYIKITGKEPNPEKKFNDIKEKGLITENHLNSMMTSEEKENYKYFIDKTKGILKIWIKIDDDDSGQYFTNSFKYSNKPNTCNDKDSDCPDGYSYETLYIFDNEVFKILNKP